MDNKVNQVYHNIKLALSNLTFDLSKFLII